MNQNFPDRLLGRTRGRRPGDRRKRHDITVFNKTGSGVRAVIEIKTKYTNRTQGVETDATKIKRHFRHRHHARSGYLLVYSTAGGPNRETTLSKRFTRWTERFGNGWCFLDVKTGSLEDADDEREWAWGIALLRYK